MCDSSRNLGCRLIIEGLEYLINDQLTSLDFVLVKMRQFCRFCVFAFINQLVYKSVVILVNGYYCWWTSIEPHNMYAIEKWHDLLKK